jgi:hypothetical protein
MHELWIGISAFLLAVAIVPAAMVVSGRPRTICGGSSRDQHLAPAERGIDHLRSWIALSPRRVHRDKHGWPGRARGRVLRQAR